MTHQSCIIRLSYNIFVLFNRWRHTFSITAIRGFYLWCAVCRGVPRRDFLFLFVRRGNISPCRYMRSVGEHPRAPFCRSLFIPISWKRWHKWCRRHILGIKIQLKHKSVPNYIPARDQDIGLSSNAVSKKDIQI